MSFESSLIPQNPLRANRRKFSKGRLPKNQGTGSSNNLDATDHSVAGPVKETESEETHRMLVFLDDGEVPAAHYKFEKRGEEEQSKGPRKRSLLK